MNSFVNPFSVCPSGAIPYKMPHVLLCDPTIVNICPYDYKVRLFTTLLLSLLWSVGTKRHQKHLSSLFFWVRRSCERTSTSSKRTVIVLQNQHSLLVCICFRRGQDKPTHCSKSPNFSHRICTLSLRQTSSSPKHVLVPGHFERSHFRQRALSGN